MTVKKASLIVGFISLIVLTLMQLKPRPTPKINTLEINGKSITIEIATDSSQRTLGLSNRDSLAENSGLLFIFPDPGFHGIWMKNMRFPIDIIWLKDGKVVDMALEVPLSENQISLPTYYPKEPANYVLEIGSGKAREWGIEIGTKINLAGD